MIVKNSESYGVFVLFAKVFILTWLFLFASGVVIYPIDRSLCYRDGTEMGLETKYANFTCYVKVSEKKWVNLSNYRGFFFDYEEVYND